MPRFAANLSMLWPELDVYERFHAAAEAGFSRVEILFVHVLDRERIARLVKDLGLELVLFDPAPGDWEAAGLAASRADRMSSPRRCATPCKPRSASAPTVSTRSSASNPQA